MTSRDSTSLADKLRQMILDEELKPGQHIVEARLAQSLGISRTPLREGLSKLVQEGLIVAEHNKGFKIAPLTAREVRELYPIISRLECLAVESGAPLVFTAVDELKAINDRFARSTRATQLSELDSLFHETLIASSNNRHLLEILAGLKRRISRYEQTYMSNKRLVATSVKQHEQICDFLERQDVSRATKALEENWHFGMSALLKSFGEP